MYCTRCGQENDDQTQFCRSGGSALQEPIQKRGIQRWLTDKGILADIGLIASLLALIGIFTPWFTRHGVLPPNVSAWDAMTGVTVWNMSPRLDEEPPTSFAPLIVCLIKKGVAEGAAFLRPKTYPRAFINISAH